MAGEPSSAPKNARGDAEGNSRIEPRTISRPPTGALAIPSKNPKAPLPPRASQADAFEVSNVHPSVRRGAAEVDIEELEPESLEPAATIRHVDELDAMRAHVRNGPPSKPKPPPSSYTGHEEAETAAVLPKDFSKALQQLEERRQQRGSTPPPPSRTEVLKPQIPVPVVKSGSWESQRDALLQLQKQRDSGAPAPPPPPKSYPGNTPPRASNPFDGPGPSTQKMDALPRPNMKDDLPSAKDLAKNLQRTPSAAPPPPTTGASPSVVMNEHTAPGGGPSLLQSLGLAPNTIPTNNGGGVNGLNLKPGSGTPLAPVRSPSPMAIVGGSSLRINSPDRPMSPAMGLGKTGPRPSMPNAESDLSPLPMPHQRQAGNTPQRPPTAPKSFAPSAGGPPQQYERAFRQWSSPAINEAGAESQANPLTSEAVSFQVYTPRDVASGRGPMRTISPEAAMQQHAAAQKTSMGLRIVLGVVGGIVVLLTALAVIAVSTEDPKKPAPVPSAKPIASMMVDDSPPPPPPIVVGDPSDDPSPVTSAAAAAPTATARRVKAATAATTTTTTTSTNATSPSSLKQIAPPPNPYGNK